MEKAIEVNNLSYKINDSYILRDISFTIDKGSINYLFGHNGSGKTTLIKLILGLLNKLKGDIKVFGYSNTQENIAKNISYLSQYPNIDRDFPISVRELIELTCKTQGNCPYKAHEHLNEFNSLDTIDKKIGQLSGGQLQKALISRALIGKKPILILDEPFNNLDERSEIQLVKLIKQLNHEQGTTIIIITHDESIVEQNSDGLLLMHGSIYQGKSEDILKDHDLKIK